MYFTHKTFSLNGVKVISRNSAITTYDLDAIKVVLETQLMMKVSL